MLILLVLADVRYCFMLDTTWCVWEWKIFRCTWLHLHSYIFIHSDTEPLYHCYSQEDPTFTQSPRDSNTPFSSRSMCLATHLFASCVRLFQIIQKVRSLLQLGRHDEGQHSKDATKESRSIIDVNTWIRIGKCPTSAPRSILGILTSKLLRDRSVAS